MGTFIVGAIVFAIVAAIIIKLIRNKASGKPPACSCGCSGCDKTEGSK